MGERRGTKALELWCRRMTEGYPGVKIDNMTTSWRDGLAFCAMIHHFRPELIEFEKLNKDDVYYNNDLAFRTAERHLGIPALLDADDMASYEVPDRLSILTYLSQFYQVFASQDSNRLNNKRTSTVAEKSSIPKPTGPPPKMAHVVGVPKRDPCQKCSLPVFLAERLTIGKRVYHRTCLKCARCNSQLTPGSFYETEIDGEYCCETCPDEEKTLDKSSFNKERESEIGSSSIADRLAFFENDGKKVLQKSLSDEEKSQSLKKISEAHSSTVYKPNTSLSNFMNNHLGDDLDSPSHSNSRRSSRTSIYSSDSSAIEDISEGPPELPKTLPPPLEEDIANSKSLKNTSPDTSLVDTTSIIKQTPPDVNNKNETQNENIQDETHISQNEPSALDSTEQHEQIEENPPCPSTPTNTTVTTENDLNLSVNVTKDSPEDDGQMRTREDQTPTDKIISNIDPSLTDDSPSTNRSSMVRARLHQFEVIANKPQDSSISSVSKTKLSDFNKTRKSSIDENPKSLETEVPKFDSKQEDSVMLQPSTDKLTNKIEENDENASYHNMTEENKDVNEEKAIQEIDNSNDTIEEDKQTELRENNEDSTELPESKEDSTELLENKEDSTELPESKEDSTELPESKEDSTELPENKEHSVLSALPAPVISPRRKISDSAAFIPDVVDSYKPPVMQVEVPDNKNDGAVIPTEEYPEDLNPFKSDDDEECDLAATSTKEKRKSLNPFDSSDDEEQIPGTKVKPPRPPPPKKISTNPFGSESEDDDQLNSIESKSSSTPKRVPVPTPRNCKSTSQNPTPEPTPRVTRQRYGTPLKNSEEYYGSSISLSAPGLRDVNDFSRDSEVRGSNRSLASSSGSTSTRYRKTKKAPAPPPPTPKTAKELFPTHDSDSKKSSPNSSKATTPTLRKKRPAPPPPSVSKSEISLTSPVKSPIPALPETPLIIESPNDELNNSEQSPATIEKLSDEEKALLEKKVPENIQSESQSSLTSEGSTKRRIVALDACLIEDANSSQDLQIKEEENTVYRRVIASLDINDPAISFKYHDGESHDRQLEKLKDNKEAKNRNRQSQISLSPEENDPLFNKSIHGKWKRRKGPAPALPVPPKKVLQMLPLQEIRHELEIIEVQQQGLEKQGVMLEKMIRERCEGPVGMESIIENPGSVPNSKEVEDLILQLFELVNEKNELFRRQAELMYLRRQHRLEQEQADLEYEIRVLMAQPERNKTDSDKAREEALIARLVEVVQLRNEVVECLEMDRLREAEEDLSIKQRLEMHSAKRDEELNKQTPTKLSKKEKKKQKELKKLGKSKKLDADKDADESEISAEKQKLKKKKKISILKAINF